MPVDGREQRRHVRIETSLECTVIAGEKDFSARVANLSRGGAGLLGPGGLAESGAPLLLLLERREGDFALALQARVMRLEEHPEGTLYGVHFEDIPPDVDAELLRLLGVLASGPGQGRRENPRVAARARVRCASRQEFEATLNDLSLGGLSVTTEQVVVEGDAVRADISVGDGGVITAVTGVVVGVIPRDDGTSRVSLKLEPPSADERTRMLLLLEVMLALGAPTSRAR